MATYIDELLTYILYTIIVTFSLLLLLGLIYHLTKESDTTFTKFLDKNKVYLDIFLIVALSFMSISIAINANSIATTANQIAENDLQIQKDANQPIFKFEKVTYGNGSSVKIAFYNEGRPVNNIIEISPITYLTVYSYDSGHYEGVTIQLHDYYHTGHKVNDEATNEFYEVSGSGNMYSLSKFLHDMEEVEIREDCSINIGWNELILIEYEDIYGEIHEDLYTVGDWHHHQLSDEEADEIYKILASSPYSLRMDELNAENVYEIFKVETKGT